MTQWYLRNSEDRIYGPVSLSTLQLWAADGRVAPEDYVSADQEDWRPAPDLRELSMNWFVDGPDDSRYGPVHLLALRDMLREGYVETTGFIENRHTGEKQEIGRALLPMLMKQNANLIDQSARFQAQLRDLETRSGEEEIAKLVEENARLQARIRDIENRSQDHNDLLDQLTRLQAQNRELELLAKEQEHELQRADPGYQAHNNPLMQEWKQVAQSKDTYEKEARKWKQLFDEERASQEQVEKALNEQIRDLRSRLMEAETARERMAFQINQMERRMESARTAKSEEGSETTPGELWDAYNNLSTNYDSLLQQLKEKSEELRELVATREENERLADSRMKQMDDLLQRERKEADKARRRLEELEEAHLQLVRSYREMNDRFIRMRQHATEHAPPVATPSRKPSTPPEHPPEPPRGEEKDVESNVDDTEADWTPKVRLT